jgi:aminopeptidase N
VNASAHVEVAPPTLTLPPIAHPEHVDLELALDPSKPDYSGAITFALHVDAPTRTLWLNAVDLVLRKATVTLPDGTSLDARPRLEGEDFAAFDLDRELAIGPATLRVEFNGKLDPERSRGLYAVSESEGADDRYIYSFFEALDARRAFPCFDEPRYKTPWRLTITAKKDHVALANAPIEKETVDGAMKVVRFADSKPMPSYLVALVVGPFDVVNNATNAGDHGTPLRFIVPRGHRDETRYAAQITPKIVGALERYFDMPYPFTKLDVAVVPRYWGTMEHPGLVALGQPLTLIPTNDETLQRRERYTNIAAHELAHYWFGDYVTTAWWDDTWLNEALAEWLDLKITNEVEQKFRFDLQRFERAEGAMQADSLMSVKPIRVPIASKSDIETSFDGDITYLKGSTVMGMFEAYLGEAKMRDAMRKYMRDHAWKNVVADDFFAALDGARPGLSKSFRSFIERPGVPLVTASIVCDAGKPPRLQLAQRRFLPRGMKETEASPPWQIPICAKYPSKQGTSSACGLLTDRDGSIDLPGDSCPSWAYANEGAHGYYRLALTEKDLATLGGVKDLDLAERVRVLGDAAAMVDAGTLPIGDALKLVAPAFGTNELHPIQAATGLLSRAQSRELPDDLRASYARFVQRHASALATQLGWRARPEDTSDKLRLRPMILELVAFSGEDAPTRKKALTLARAWLKDHKTLDDEMAHLALSIAATTNDASFFDALLAAARATKDRRERGMLLGALGGFTSDALVDRALALVLDGGFDLRDSLGILEAAQGGRTTRERAWAFEKKRFDDLAHKMRSDEAQFLFGAPFAFCDAAHRAEMEQFLRPRVAKIDGAAQRLEQALESNALCEASVKADRASLEAFLKSAR